jgi:death-on-curing protein
VADPRFLTVDEVIVLHAEAIQFYGGEPGLLDYSLLESAVMAPQASFGGEYLYKNIHAMAAAYWYSLVKNHSFVDGNKRVGLHACDAFLAFNGLQLTLSSEKAEEVTFAIAKGEITREGLIEILEQSVGPLEL